MLRVPDLPGTPAGHRVACHWTEQIATGEIRPHEVAPDAAGGPRSDASLDTSLGAKDLVDPVQ